MLAVDVVRYHGEPVAVVAADHPETARLALADIGVDYEALDPSDRRPRRALAPGAPLVHPRGNVVRHVRIRKGDVAAAAAEAEVVVTGEYEVGMQDQAFLGLESGLAVPADDGGIDLYVATQWMHVDRDQIAASLGLPMDKVRLHLAGVGGAFGAREDLSMQIHASCWRSAPSARSGWSTTGRSRSSATSTGIRPRCATSTAPTPTGGWSTCGPTSCSTAGPTPRARRRWRPTPPRSASGPYEVANVEIDSWAVYTNNPPCGAMRGFGAVQACFAYEAQMDQLAARLGLDPVELRIRNAMTEGTTMPTGQVVDSAAPVAELLRLGARPAPAPVSATPTTASTSATSPAGWPTRPTARGSSAGSATASGSRTCASRPASTTRSPPGCGWRSWPASRS